MCSRIRSSEILLIRSLCYLFRSSVHFLPAFNYDYQIYGFLSQGVLTFFQFIVCAVVLSYMRYSSVYFLHFDHSVSIQLNSSISEGSWDSFRYSSVV